MPKAVARYRFRLHERLPDIQAFIGSGVWGRNVRQWEVVVVQIDIKRFKWVQEIPRDVRFAGDADQIGDLSGQCQ
jgi:hypothetical protein